MAQTKYEWILEMNKARAELIETRKEVDKLKREVDKLKPAGDKAEAALKKTGTSATRAGNAMKTGSRGVGQFAGAATTAANSANRSRFMMFQLTSAAQDFAVVLQGGGGLNRALLGASNNFGVLASSAGPLVAILGTAAVIAIPTMIQVLMGMSESVGENAERYRDLTESMIENERQSRDLAEAKKELRKAELDLVRSTEPTAKSEARRDFERFLGQETRRAIRESGRQPEITQRLRQRFEFEEFGVQQGVAESAAGLVDIQGQKAREASGRQAVAALGRGASKTMRNRARERAASRINVFEVQAREAAGLSEEEQKRFRKSITAPSNVEREAKRQLFDAIVQQRIADQRLAAAQLKGGKRVAERIAGIFAGGERGVLRRVAPGIAAESRAAAGEAAIGAVQEDLGEVEEAETKARQLGRIQNRIRDVRSQLRGTTRFQPRLQRRLRDELEGLQRRAADIKDTSGERQLKYAEKTNELLEKINETLEVIKEANDRAKLGAGV